MNSLTAKYLFTGLLALGIIVSFTATSFYLTNRIDNDARRINLAGRERMLSFEMAWLLNRAARVEGRDRAELIEYLISDELPLFEEILYALRDGSSRHGLEPLHQKEAFSSIDALIKDWLQEVKPMVLRAKEELEAGDAGALDEYNRLIHDYVEKIDAFVGLLVKIYERELGVYGRLRLALTVAAVLFFVVLAVYVRKRVVNPILSYARASKSIGRGRFDVRVDAAGGDEIGELGSSLNTMAGRLELLFQERSRHLQELNLLYEVSKVANRYREPEEMLEGFIDEILRHEPFRVVNKGAIFLCDEKGRRLRLAVSRNFSNGQLRYCSELRFGECLCGLCAEKGEPFFPDAEREDVRSKCPDFNRFSHIILPLKSKTDLHGVLCLYVTAGARLPEESRGLYLAVADIITVGIHNAMNYRTIKALATFPEKNPYPVIECGADYTITYLNPAARHLVTQLRLEAGSLLPAHLREIVQGLRASGRELSYAEVRVKDTVFGEYVHLLEDRETVRIYAYDITEHKRAEERLKSYSNQLLSLNEASNSLMEIKEIDEVKDVYQRISDIALEAFGLRMVWLGVIEEGDFDVRPVAVSGYEEGYLSGLVIRWDDSPEGSGPIGQAIKVKTPVVMNDIEADPVFAQWRERAMQRGYRSVAAIPLIYGGDTVIGHLSLYSSEPGFFNDDRVRILQSFANHAATAINNARLVEGLEEKVRERTRELMTYSYRLRKLYELSYAVTSGVREHAKRILSGVTEMLDVDAAMICRIEGDVCEILVVADRKEIDIKEGMRIPLENTYCGIIKETESPLVINDARSAGELGDDICVREFGVLSYLGVPIFIRDGFFGVLATFSKTPHEYTGDDTIIHSLISKRLEFEFIKEEYERDLMAAKVSAESASKAKSEFLANMSHELRTPLNAIMGFSEMMLQGMAGGLTEKQREFLRDIHESGVQLLSLINDILDLSKIEAGKMELFYSEVDVAQLIEKSLVFFKEKALRHRLSLTSRIAEDVGTVEMDEKRMKQVLVNLLSNAVKFTPDGGSITVHARRRRGPAAEDLLEVTVQDTGIGIRDEDMHRLFEPFQQLESTYEKRYQGTGLGLAMVKNIVELHGGDVRAESEYGRGSRFTFVIPVKRGGAVRG